MSSHASKPALDQPALELVVSSALYLMSAYGRNGGSAQMAAMVVRHWGIDASDQGRLDDFKHGHL